MREAAIALALLAAGLAGCIGSTDEDPVTATQAPDTEVRVPPDVWEANLSEPVYESITSHVAELTSEDGTRLSVSLHLPTGLEDGKQIPTLLQITPYQSFVFPHLSTPITGTEGPSSSAWAGFVERGAAYVEADARGTGASEGCLDFGGSLDRADARALLDWIRSQPWSNGVVVTDGGSHPGMGSLVAHAGAPSVDASIAVAPVVSYYQDEWYQGAKFEDQMNGIGYTTVESSPPAYTDPDALAAQADDCHHETMADFGTVEGPFTETWADRDLSRHVEEARSPVLLTHGFVDVNVHPDHTQAYWDALPDDFPKHMILGWWAHSWPDMDGHPFDEYEELRHRWLDATLFGHDNGLWDEPRVLVEDDEGTWHESRDWPIDGSRTLTLNATPEGALADAPAETGGLSYVDDPSVRRGAWGEAKVLFATEPLTEERLINGAPTVRLQGSSTADATKWVAYLVELTDEDEVQRITHGYADSHTYGEEGTWQAMEPGEPYTWTIELIPTAVRVEEGHKIGLLVASQDSRRTDDVHQYYLGQDEGCWADHRGGCYEPSGIVPAETAGQAENTVHTGPDGTQVTLSWVNPDTTAKPPWS